MVLRAGVGDGVGLAVGGTVGVAVAVGVGVAPSVVAVLGEAVPALEQAATTSMMAADDHSARRTGLVFNAPSQA